ncbi:hypothetical protein TSUD_422070, partial [Trifolium subterraneum]
TSNHPAIASSSRLDTKNYEALLSEVASKMVKISSTLYEVVGLVKKQTKRIELYEENMLTMNSVLDNTIDRVKDNVTRTDELHGICKVILNKLDNMDGFLQQQTLNGRGSLSPHTMSTPSSSRKSKLSPNNMSPLSQNEDISNIVFIPSSDEEDIQKSRKRGKKVNEKTSGGYKTGNNTNKKHTSKLPSTICREVNEGSSSMVMASQDVEGMVGRMLSFRPSPKIGGLKIPKAEPSSKFIHKSFLKNKSESLQLFKPTGHTLSKVN